MSWVLSTSTGSETSVNDRSREHEVCPFDSLLWLDYFERNQRHTQWRSVFLDWEEPVTMSEELKVPLLKTLQKFQLGETGSGEHLRKYAKTTGDEYFSQCVDMFVKEEQTHALLLAKSIAVLGGQIIHSHWTDSAFVAIRHLFGLKTELLILYVAEIIGKNFYKTAHHQVRERSLANLFSQLVFDEIGHLQFHTEYLRTAFASCPPAGRQLISLLWRVIFYPACLVFIFDNLTTLRRLGSGGIPFLKDCADTFEQGVAAVLGGNR